MPKANFTISGNKGKIMVDIEGLTNMEITKIVNFVTDFVTDDVELSPLDKELIGLIKAGTLLMAVKRKRDESGMDLKEAKDYCDNLKAKHCK